MFIIRIHTFLFITDTKNGEYISCQKIMKGSDFERGVIMSYVAPELKERFESLSPGLRSIILERNVQLNTIHDLIRVLEEIVAEADSDD